MSPADRIAASLRVEGAERMVQLGVALGERLRLGDVVLLHGDLGAGKTTLAQGIARGLGVTGPVQSPTFTLVAEYDARLADGSPARLYHLDLYRLTDPAELESIGYETYIAPADGVTLVEWPERAGAELPERYLLITITHDGPARRVQLQIVSPDGVSPYFDIGPASQDLADADDGEHTNPPWPATDR